MRNLCKSRDLIIRGGLVYDGSGRAPFNADISVRNGMIEEIGCPSENRRVPVLDAQGLLITPGFIDIHGHTDEQLLINPHAPSKVFQGITTEVMGNCGFSPAPLYGECRKEFSEELSKNCGFQVSWTGCAEFFSLLEAKGMGLNAIMLAGNGNLRGGVLGYEHISADPGSLGEMKAMLVTAMQDGAWGLSSGLIYVPSCFATTQELTELGSVSREQGGIYATHMRGEGDHLIEALREALAVAEGSGVPLQISHLKASGEPNWPKLSEAIEAIGKSRQRGMDVWCDVYPYPASSTGLSSFFPPWLRDGGRKALVERLKCDEARERLESEFHHRSRLWGTITLTSMRKKENQNFVGKSLLEVSKFLEKRPLDAAIDLLVREEGEISIINFSQSEENVMKVMKLPFSLIGTDAAARFPEEEPSRGLPHPRAYGTCARVLGHYVRDKGLLSLTEAIDKMTSLPARRLGLRGRGFLRNGYYADITIFDPARVEERSTFTSPHRYPAGIEYVIINGVPVVSRGMRTGALPGRVLRRYEHSAGRASGGREGEGSAGRPGKFSKQEGT